MKFTKSINQTLDWGILGAKVPTSMEGVVLDNPVLQANVKYYSLWIYFHTPLMFHIKTEPSAYSYTVEAYKLLSSILYKYYTLNLLGFLVNTVNFPNMLK